MRFLHFTKSFAPNLKSEPVNFSFWTSSWRRLPAAEGLAGMRRGNFEHKIIPGSPKTKRASGQIFRYLGSREFIFLLFIFVISFVIRVYKISELGWFSFEQGRDLFVAQKIRTFQDFILVGAVTDIEGVFHGVWYYYILALITFVTGGSPIYTFYAFAAVGSIVPIVIYLTCKELALDTKTCAIATAITSVSFSFVQYSRYLSNPSFAPLVVVLFVYCLVKYKNSSFTSVGWAGTAAALLALHAHFELLNIICGVFMVLLLLAAMYIKVRVETALVCVTTFATVSLPYIIYLLKHNFVTFKTIIAYLRKHDSTVAESHPIRHFIEGYSQEISSVFSMNESHVPAAIYYLIIIAYLVLAPKKHKVFVIAALAWPLPLLPLLGPGFMTQFFAGLNIFIVLTVAIAIDQVVKTVSARYIWLTTATSCTIILLFTVSSLQSKYHIFYNKIQPTLSLGQQTQAVRYVLSQTTRPGWDSFNLPYKVRQNYEYLFHHYNQGLPDRDVDPKIFFTITEPGTQGHFRQLWETDLNSRTNLIETKYFGDLRVQMRKWND